MSVWKIKLESLAKRCEICHKADFFDAVKNSCSRCIEVSNKSLITNKLVPNQPQRRPRLVFSNRCNTCYWQDSLDPQTGQCLRCNKASNSIKETPIDNNSYTKNSINLSLQWILYAGKTGAIMGGFIGGFVDLYFCMTSMLNGQIILHNPFPQALFSFIALPIVYAIILGLLGVVLTLPVFLMAVSFHYIRRLKKPRINLQHNIVK